MNLARFVLSLVCDVAGHRWQRAGAETVECRRCGRMLNCYHDRMIG